MANNVMQRTIKIDDQRFMKGTSIEEKNPYFDQLKSMAAFTSIDGRGQTFLADAGEKMDDAAIGGGQDDKESKGDGLDAMTKKELLAFAENNGHKVDSRSNKTDLLAAIRSQLTDQKDEAEEETSDDKETKADDQDGPAMG